MKDNFTRNCVVALVVFCVIGAVAYVMVGRRSTGGMGTGAAKSAVSSRNLVETTVQFYFADRNTGMLTAEQRTFTHPEAPVDFAKMIVAGLISGPEQGGIQTLPSETSLRAFYIMKDGTAVADFTKEMAEKHPGGARTEYLTVMSLIQSLTMNIPDIKRVTILIDGKEVETLAGHIDLSQPITPDMALAR
jgi:spore germination protein GerM